MCLSSERQFWSVFLWLPLVLTISMRHWAGLHARRCTVLQTAACSSVNLLFHISCIFFSSVRLFKYFYFLPSLLKCRLPLRFFPLIAWLPVLVLSLREVLPLIASFGGWLFCTAPHPIWPSSGGKAEWQPHNDQCLRAWLIPHVQTGDWLLGPD